LPDEVNSAMSKQPIASTMADQQYLSWGRYPRSLPAQITQIAWPGDLSVMAEATAPLLAYNHGRSYGDCCLNEGGHLLDVRGLDHILAFDVEQGIMRCESGVSLADILSVSVPRGWFLPVTPGTKYVGIGGAIANDVHGKNHHIAGTFGNHVLQFALLRSSGELFNCSPTENTGLFRATIGGLGLTGVILWADIQLL